jgi:hypothetical protein
MEHKDAMEREIQTKTLWDAHSTQRHRGTEAQRHRNTEGRIEHRTQNNNLFFEFYVQFFPLCGIISTTKLTEKEVLE